MTQADTPSGDPPTTPLRITVLIDRPKHTGGMMALLEYAIALRRMGHDVELLTLDEDGPLSHLTEHARVVSRFSSDTVRESDLLLATGLKEVAAGYATGRGKMVHFCQGFQVADLEERSVTFENRLEAETLTLRMPTSRLWRRARTALKRRSWQKRIARAERTYQLPTHLVCCTPHLKKLVEARYGRPAILCRYGINPAFSPAPALRTEKFDKDHPCRVVCVGGYERWFKGIADTNQAIETVKSRGYPVEYVRVSPTPFFDLEKSQDTIDEFHENLSPEELGELFRGSDVYISNSLESEGFGLPAMEALCCGVPSILSDISSYSQFSDAGETGYAVLVPQRNPEATATELQKLIEGPAETRRALREAALRVAAGYDREVANRRFARAMEEIASR